MRSCLREEPGGRLAPKDLLFNCGHRAAPTLLRAIWACYATRKELSRRLTEDARAGVDLFAQYSVRRERSHGFGKGLFELGEPFAQHLRRGSRARKRSPNQFIHGDEMRGAHHDPFHEAEAGAGEALLRIGRVTLLAAMVDP